MPRTPPVDGVIADLRAERDNSERRHTAPLIPTVYATAIRWRRFHAG
jgi:hypothetical protein